MKFMADHYLEEPYAPNTREAVRRFTVHQFLAAGVVVANPDDPVRPVNSPNYGYQVPAELLLALRTFGTSSWADALERWRGEVPSLRERWASERDMALIAVTLPDGDEVALTPGGQNLLIALIIEDFCARFTPGGEVLYVGDAGAGDPVFRWDQMAELGFTIDEHGKLPDVVVWMPDREWLVLIEAVTSHGPIDPLRKADLTRLLGSSSRLMFVTAFPEVVEGGEGTDAVFVGGGQVAPKVEKRGGALDGAEPAGDLLVDFDHPDITFGEVVVVMPRSGSGAGGGLVGA